MLKPRYGTHDFDNSGTFTPAIIVECDGDDRCTYILFYGGVRDQSAAHAEEVGVAISTSPWGPFERYVGNPVFSRNDLRWCGLSGNLAPARVDEIKPFSLDDGKKYLAVKSVCGNFTALPIVYTPQNSSSWKPPYHVYSSRPLVFANQTCQRMGFEEPTVLRGPDNIVHLLGHDHGRGNGSGCYSGGYAHFVRTGGEGVGDWVSVGGIDPASKMLEPIPVPLGQWDGVFGGRVSDRWIDFGTLNGGKVMHLFLSEVTWH